MQQLTIHDCATGSTPLRHDDSVYAGVLHTHINLTTAQHSSKQGVVDNTQNLHAILFQHVASIL